MNHIRVTARLLGLHQVSEVCKLSPRDSCLCCAVLCFPALICSALPQRSATRQRKTVVLFRCVAWDTRFGKYDLPDDETDASDPNDSIC